MLDSGVTVFPCGANRVGDECVPFHDSTGDDSMRIVFLGAVRYTLVESVSLLFRQVPYP